MLQLCHDKVWHQLVSLADEARAKWITVSVETVESNATEAGATDEKSNAEEVEVKRQFGPFLCIYIAVSLHFRLTGGIVSTPHDSHANDRVPQCGR